MLLFNTANITHMLKHKLPKCSGSLHRHCSGAAVSMASPAQDTQAKLIDFKDGNKRNKMPVGHGGRPYHRLSFHWDIHGGLVII